MSDTLSVKAYAKINLTLDVTGVRENGYHNVKMVMQTISLCDIVSVTLKAIEAAEATESRVFVRTNLSYLPVDSRNIAYMAAVKFFEYLKRRGISFPAYDVYIRIRKYIPVGAGLAGGSTNAAAVLRALNEMTNAKLSISELMSIGIGLGADVPYCICGGTKLVKGIGEFVLPLPPLPDCYILLAKPSFSVSTPNVYAEIDKTGELIAVDTNGMIEAVKNKSVTDIGLHMKNVMEYIVSKKQPEIAHIKEILIKHGASGASMSGSGPTVYGIFHVSKRDDVYAAREELLNTYKEIFIAKPVIQ